MEKELDKPEKRAESKDQVVRGFFVVVVVVAVLGHINFDRNEKRNCRLVNDVSVISISICLHSRDNGTAPALSTNFPSTLFPPLC